jgi:DNA-nicking Smr family endonuclease
VRSLSPDEAALWRRVTASIRPLSRDVTDQPAEQPTENPKPVKPTKAVARRPLQPATALGRSRLGTSLDSSWDKRLKSGSVEPDRILDLHGMNLDTAWRAIDQGLERAIGRGERVVLLVTGHHRPGEPPVQRGKIRAAVHDWLAASRHAADIAAVRGAHKRHGGGGSLYLILRRR